jgi:hypothetical protein
VGTFALAQKGKVTVKLEPGVSVTLLTASVYGQADQIRWRGHFIRSVRRLAGVGPSERRASGIRVRDKNNHLRKVFTGTVLPGGAS